ncbi:MAG: 50S ribosomal protein L9 [Alphaproteobacteria bacterium]|nr:MAG: 50S ribosomal protein L9 [Alphaproteobacteria bacterium]
MELILLERIERLGHMGDVVHVKPGFARNFLLPQQKALRATASNKSLFEARRAELEAANADQRKAAEIQARSLDGTRLTVLRQAGEAGQLYGSVSARDVTEAAQAIGVTIDRRTVVIDVPIKTIGMHKVRVRLHPEVNVHVEVNVARSEAEAEAALKNIAKAAERTADDSASAAAADAAAESARLMFETPTTEGSEA